MKLRNTSDQQLVRGYCNREGRTAPLRELDLESLPSVPLPHAPVRWGEKRSQRERKTTEARDSFEIRDAGWRLKTVEKLSITERPDPAFRRLYPVDSGLLMIDDLGKAKGLGPIKAAALFYDRRGRLVAKAGFVHGLYRLNVHPLGRGLVAMSAHGVLHVYDEDLQPLFETPLADAPQIVGLCQRFDICDDQLKNHIRAVALSRDHRRYLFSAVDEAWCVSRHGLPIWGVRFPVREDWRRVAAQSFGTDSEIASALALMKLSLPLTPEQIKRRYRELALLWHPDRNQGHPQAQEKMKALNAAMELLTGVDLEELDGAGKAPFVYAGGCRELDIGGSKVLVNFGFGFSELYARDWIYAADFAACSNSVYLAAYSGRVVLVTSAGEGLRVYDIGSPAKRIIDTGDYLYILTPTRLYVLRDDSLHALVDTLDSGELVLAKNGFGLLEKKRWRWFSKAGGYLGSVLTTDPIRRVYCAAGALVVETRQRRAVISGAPRWWD